MATFIYCCRCDQVKEKDSDTTSRGESILCGSCHRAEHVKEREAKEYGKEKAS